MWPMKHNGLALALSLASILNFGLLTMALRRKMGALGWRRVAASVTRSGVCATLMGIGVWALSLWLLPTLDMHWMRVLTGLTLCIIFGAVLFGSLAVILKAPELTAVFQIAAGRK